VSAAGIKMNVPATAASVPTVRAAVSRFVDEHWPEACRDGADIALAVTEACSNAVQHAYPAGAGEMTITSRVRDHHLTIRVRDHGSGIATPSVNPGLGVGVKLIHALSEATIISTARGTSVVLRFAL
jgi:anti-sigma regulatory factor (Ser/Thr protein kinase)